MTGNRTQVSGVAPLKRDPSQDALSTELPCPQRRGSLMALLLLASKLDLPLDESDWLQPY